MWQEDNDGTILPVGACEKTLENTLYPLNSSLIIRDYTDQANI